MKNHTLYSLGWYHDRAEVVVMERVAGAPQPPGKGWRRGCQPLRDGRWTWLLSMPPLQPPASTCRVWKHLSERLDDMLPTENA